MSPTVAKVRFVAAPELDAQLGMLGWINCEIERLRIDGIVLRRTSDGRLDLRYPSKPRAGGGHAIVRPTDEWTRRRIEEQIFAALERQGVLP